MPVPPLLPPPIEPPVTIGAPAEPEPIAPLAQERAARPGRTIQNVVWLSPKGDGLSLAFRLKQEGHTIAVWVKDPMAKVAWTGLLYQVDELRDALALVKPNTLLVFDGVGGGRTADRFRAQDVRVFGGSRLADRLELDHEFALEVMKRAGISVPETLVFDDIYAAKEFVQKSNKRWVFKPMKRDVPAAVTFAAEDVEQMLDWLSFVQANAKKVRFMLQEFVEGVEIAVEGWFDGRKWLLPFNHTMEEKKLSSGCVGSVVWNCEVNRIVESTLMRLTPFLVDKYVGPLNINCIVRDQAFALELTPRFSFDAIFAFSEMVEDELGKTLTDVTEGRLSRLPVKMGGYAISVRVLYDRDSVTQKFLAGLPVHGVTREMLRHVWFTDMKLSEGGRPVSAGIDGNFFTVTAEAPTLAQSIALVYDRLRAIKVPSGYYKDDIGQRVVRDHQELGDWLEQAPPDRYAASIGR